MTTLTYTRLAIDLCDHCSSTVGARGSRLGDHSGDGRGSNVPADLAELDSVCCFRSARLAGFQRGADLCDPINALALGCEKDWRGPRQPFGGGEETAE